MQSLKEMTIEALFREYDETDQLKLLRKLMTIAKVDSIIQNRKTSDQANDNIEVPESETAEEKREREYHERFNKWIYQFLPTFLTVIKDSYLDACFELYDLIVKGSKGIDAVSTTGNEEGDDACGIYANDVTNSGDDFADQYTKHIKCNFAMIVGDMRNKAIFSRAGTPQSYLFIISFEDLFINLYHKGQDVHIILFLLGFFDHNEVLMDKTIARMKELFFPNWSDADARGHCFAMALRGGVTLDRSTDTKKKILEMFPGFKILEFAEEEPSITF